jgi:hypothetical protein
MITDRRIRRHTGVFRVLSRSWHTGAMLAGIGGMLFVYLVLYFI